MLGRVGYWLVGSGGCLVGIKGVGEDLMGRATIGSGEHR